MLGKLFDKWGYSGTGFLIPDAVFISFLDPSRRCRCFKLEQTLIQISDVDV
jgi:hypothetical protein